MQLAVCGSAATENIFEAVRLRLERFSGLQVVSLLSSDAPVSETWQDGLDATAVLILLDAAGMPPKPSPQFWASLIEHKGAPPVAFFKCGSCVYPSVFDRRTMLADERAIERWAAQFAPSIAGPRIAPADADIPAELWTALVDRSEHFWLTGATRTGKSRIAQAFAHASRGHFQSTLWIGCGARDSAAIERELAHRLTSARTLVILDDLRAPLDLPPGPVLITARDPLGDGEWLHLEDRYPPPAAGELSEAMAACFAPNFPLSLAREILGHPALPEDAAELLFTEGERYRFTGSFQKTNPARHFAAVAARFRQWRTDPARAAEVEYELPAACEFAYTHSWSEAQDLARSAFGFFCEVGRIPDGVAILEQFESEAFGHGDRAAAEWARSELSWVSDRENEPIAVIAAGDQLSLF